MQTSGEAAAQGEPVTGASNTAASKSQCGGDGQMVDRGITNLLAAGGAASAPTTVPTTSLFLSARASFAQNGALAVAVAGSDSASIVALPTKTPLLASSTAAAASAGSPYFATTKQPPLNGSPLATPKPAAPPLVRPGAGPRAAAVATCGIGCDQGALAINGARGGAGPHAAKVAGQRYLVHGLGPPDSL